MIETIKNLEQLEKEKSMITNRIKSNEDSIVPLMQFVNLVNKEIDRDKKRMHTVKHEIDCLTRGIRVYDERLLRHGDLLNSLGVIRCLNVLDRHLTKREYTEIIKMNYMRDDIEVTMFGDINHAWDGAIEFLTGMGLLVVGNDVEIYSEDPIKKMAFLSG